MVCTPDIKVFERTSEDVDVLIASDGLWDVCSTAYVAEYSASVFKKLGQLTDAKPRAIVHNLALDAHADGSRDNITVVLLRLPGCSFCLTTCSFRHTSHILEEIVFWTICNVLFRSIRFIEFPLIKYDVYPTCR